MTRDQHSAVFNSHQIEAALSPRPPPASAFSPPRRSRSSCSRLRSRVQENRNRFTRQCNKNSVGACGAPSRCRCQIKCTVPDHKAAYERQVNARQLRREKMERQQKQQPNSAPAAAEPFRNRTTSHHFDELHEKQREKIKQAKLENSMMYENINMKASARSRPRPRSAVGSTNASFSRSQEFTNRQPSRPRPRSASSQRSTNENYSRDESSMMSFGKTWVFCKRHTSHPQSTFSVHSGPTSNKLLPDCETLLSILRSKRYVSHSHWAKEKYQTFDFCSVANAFWRLQKVYKTGSDYTKVQRIRKELGNSSFAECLRECTGGHIPDGKHMGRLVELVIDHCGNDIHKLTMERFEKFTRLLKNFEADTLFENRVIFAIFDPERCSKEEFKYIGGLFKSEFPQGHLGHDRDHKSGLACPCGGKCRHDGGCTLNDFIRLSDPKSEAGIIEPDYDRLEEVVQKIRRRRRKRHNDLAAKVFKKLDLDNSGDLSRTELSTSTCAGFLKDCLGAGRHASYIDGASLRVFVDLLLARADADGHSHVSLGEFADFTWLLRETQVYGTGEVVEVDDDDGTGIIFEIRLLYALFAPVVNPPLQVDELNKHVPGLRSRPPRQRRQHQAEAKANLMHCSAHADCQHTLRNITQVGATPELGADKTSAKIAESNSLEKRQDKDVVPDTATIHRKLRERRRKQHCRWAANIFQKLDKDRSGKLCRMELGTSEFSQAIQQCVHNGEYLLSKQSGSLQKLVNFAIQKADTDGDKNLSLQEFEEFTWELQTLHSDVDFEAELIFAMFDENQNNVIDKEEYKRMFNFHSGGWLNRCSQDFVESMMQELDQDNSGTLERSEVRKWLKSIAVEDSKETLQPEGFQNPDQAAHKTWAARAFEAIGPIGGNITRIQLQTKEFEDIVRQCLPGRSIETNDMDSIMCMVDLALHKDLHDGGYLISLKQFELLLWKLRMMHKDQQACRHIESDIPPQQWLANVRKRSPPKRSSTAAPSRLNLQGLKGSESLAGEFTSSQKADLFNKLRLRRRKKHAKWTKKKFAELDIDQNGGLSRLELGTPDFAKCIRECLGEAQHLPEMSYMKSLVNFVLGRADADGDRVLSLKEFEDFTWKVVNMQSDIDFETEFMFAIFDPNTDGKLDLEEFEKLYNFQSKGGHEVSSKEYIKRLRDELDEDGDGSISVNEYRNWVRRASTGLSESETSKHDALLVNPEVRRREHDDWAVCKFALLAEGNGYVKRSVLCKSEKFLAMLQEKLPKRALDLNIIMPLVDFLMQKGDEDYHVTAEEFKTLLWKIEKLDMKSWRRPEDEERDRDEERSLFESVADDDGGYTPSSSIGFLHDDLFHLRSPKGTLTAGKDEMSGSLERVPPSPSGSLAGRKDTWNAFKKEVTVRATPKGSESGTGSRSPSRSTSRSYSPRDAMNRSTSRGSYSLDFDS